MSRRFEDTLERLSPRNVSAEIRARVDRELLFVLVFPGLVLLALVIGLVRYANLPETEAPAPAVPVPAPVVSTQRRAPETTGSAVPTAAPPAPPAPAAPRQAAPAPKPQPQSGERVYRVGAGDTLATIAVRHGVDYRRIAADNQLASPHRIRPGQLLRIGAPAPGVRVIAPGDTLTGLAAQTGLTVPQLLALNPWITNPDRIPAGAGPRIRP